MKRISDLLGDKFDRYKYILDSVMPGGENWERFIDHGDCLETCPYFEKCNGYGPSNTLCYDTWASTPAKPEAIQVLGHILKNFSFYDCNDYRGEIGDRVSELCTIFDVADTENLSPSEVQRLVTVRMAQAEFKANLFQVWGGCSLENSPVPNEYLIASHIKPWATCKSKEERVDRGNGFLLPANYDYVFDRFLVTFRDSGEIEFIKSEKLELLYSSLGINKRSKINLKSENMKYLKYHQKIFKKKSMESREV